MNDWIRRALTRRITHKSPRGKRVAIVLEPNEKLVYAVKFAISIILCLSCLEVATWPSWALGIARSSLG